jgi:hypothetical protein
MRNLPLSCPTCAKPLVYVPLDGLTLHYRCVNHGVIILQPLVVVDPEVEINTLAVEHHDSLPTFDAA